MLPHDLEVMLEKHLFLHINLEMVIKSFPNNFEFSVLQGQILLPSLQ